MRKVAGYTLVLVSIAIWLAMTLGLSLWQAREEEEGSTSPSWLGWVVWPVLIGLFIMPIAIGVHANFGRKGKALRAEQKDKLRKLKNFELDGD